MIKISLEERRRTIGRTVSTLTNKSGPLTPSERTSLQRMTQEMIDLESDIEADAHRKHDTAFRSWLRVGMKDVDRQTRAILETRDMGTSAQGAYPGITSGGGIFVPLGFFDEVTSAMKDVGPMLRVSDVIDTPTGAILPFPGENDSAVTGVIVGENAQNTMTDVSPNLTNLKAYKFSSQAIKASTELVQDGGFDFGGYLVGRFGVRIGRILNTKFTVGSGSSEPTRFVTAASVGATAAGSASNDGTGGANTIGSDDLANLEASVDGTYRQNAIFMMHANTLQALRKVKDKQGRPVFPGLHEGARPRIFNYNCEVNPAMAQLQTNAGSPPVTNSTVAFGDFSYYRIRRALPVVQRLDERFADQGQIGFQMFLRADGNLIDAGGGAIKLLQNVY